MPILQRVIVGVKEEFADAVANGGGIYGVGYCFGGKYILLLGSELQVSSSTNASTHAEPGLVDSKPLIKVGVIAHGSYISCWKSAHPI